MHPQRFQMEAASDSSQDYSESGDSYGEDDDEQVTWIEWFCGLKGNEFFAEVDDVYAQDDFNLTYLNKEMMEYYELDVYREALNMLLDYEDQEEEISEAQRPIIERAAQTLYGLIHARFILTSRGMAAMYEKFHAYTYGSCPLLDCHAQNQAVLPVGMFDVLGQGGTKIYCPRCKEIFNPKSTRLEALDGAYFGTSFPHLFFLTYPHLKPPSVPRNYVPRIFGFKVSTQLKQTLRLAAQRDREQSALANGGDPEKGSGKDQKKPDDGLKDDSD